MPIPLKWINDQTYATTVKHLSSSDVKRIRLFVPPLHEQTRIVDAVRAQTSRLDALMARAKAEIALIREYRTRLVADVVTGKLDVRDASVPDVPAEALVEPVEALGEEEIFEDA